jgi:hypothetical protein
MKTPDLPPRPAFFTAREIFFGCMLCLTISGAQAQVFTGLFSQRPSFSITNHVVSVSVFQWFSSNGGQLSGPWRPVEGRSNWTGSTNFWRSQIKQMMAANVDVLYVHLITSSESQRTNLFLTLNQLRDEGWNVPKVAPFLDPMIIWYGQPMVDLTTAAGKDAFVSHYIRFFNQYYGANRDPYADDYLYRINGRVVLDTWHVKFNLSNLASLTRNDVESRLRSALSQAHPVFTNGIYMVTTALNDPTLSFADEKVPQFEINEYFREVQWKQIWSAQLKGGYWDQNIRNPGDFLPRAGGTPYSNAWFRAKSERGTLKRVYLESWNEYDEGSGLYAASPGAPYIKPGSGNTNTDLWSRSNDPHEYIKTTRAGATVFNDWPERGAKILYHNFPKRMLPGETRTVAVVVRNEGDALWSAKNNFKFGEKEFLDATMFGPGRYHLDDTQDEITTYGGIFRGRVKNFQITIRAPTTPGTYRTHWSMVQEQIAWFGDEIVQDILVDATPIYHGTTQDIDSTSLLTNRVVDFTEHTYRLTSGAIGTYADCDVTRTFAAPVKNVRLTIISGTADDIGYVGSTLVTPNSLGTAPCATLGYVTNTIDVTSQAGFEFNRVTFTLRARENCGSGTDVGWGEDTHAGRANAKLRWEVQLAQPVPISSTVSNPATTHYYALLSPATWSWSEKVAADLGGHLSGIGNQAENDWVTNRFGAYGGTNRMLWIGFNDVAKEGTFVWSSGEPVTFTAWDSGEPNNYSGNEDFVTIYPPNHARAGKWNDWGERVFSGATPFNGVIELVPPMGPPRITTQPQNLRVNLGAPATFTVGATGSPQLRFQWRRAGANLAGATQSTLAIPAVTDAHAGAYTARVTNLLGSVVSAEGRLTVNHAPIAVPQNLTVNEDNALAITLTASDPDGDRLQWSLLAAPKMGSLVGFPAPYVTYRPATNYNGPDSFTFKVSDGLAEAIAHVNITVLPINDPPVAAGQSLSVNEDTPVTITLTGSDPDGDTLTYSITSQPLHGQISGTPPSVTYLANTNYNGPDSFMFKASDGRLESAAATITITVLPVNDAPVAVAGISPLFTVTSADTNLYVVAPNNKTATIILDGSQSTDVENDPLQFSWFDEVTTNLLGNTMLSTNVLDVGSHRVELTVSDGNATATNRIAFEVLKPGHVLAMLYELIEQADIAPRNRQPLIASLNAAMAALERGQFSTAINILRAFQSKVRVMVAPIDPWLAQELTGATERLIAVTEAGAG